MRNPLSFIGDIFGKIADKIAPDKQKIIDGQNRINEVEVAGGPASLLRLWRGFLGWVLALFSRGKLSAGGLSPPIGLMFACPLRAERYIAHSAGDAGAWPMTEKLLLEIVVILLTTLLGGVGWLFIRHDKQHTELKKN